MFVASPPACVIISHSVLFFSSRFMNDQKLKFRQGKNLERMAKIFGRRLTDIGGQSKFLFFFHIRHSFVFEPL